MGKKTRRAHGGSRKIGRNKMKAGIYKNEGRREKNKARRIKKHLKRHVNDRQSAKRLEALS